MAQVIWQKRAEGELYKLLVKGFLEFGESTANKFSDRVAYINTELTKYPEIGYFEPLLKDRKKSYRSYNINNRLKLIYYYNSKTDIVNVADIWDMRRDPKNLAKRIKPNNKT